MNREKTLFMELAKEVSKALIELTENEFIEAIEEGNEALLRRTLSRMSGKDVNFNARNSQGETLLHLLSSERRCSQVISDLGKMSDPIDFETRNTFGERPIHVAVKVGNELGVKALFKQGVDLEAKTNKGCTPLHLAFDMRYLKIIEMLCDYGAAMNAKDDRGFTPLFHALAACIFGIADTAQRKEYINRLQSLGVQLDYNVQNFDGRSLLHICAATASLSQMQVLSEHGANVNLQDRRGVTPAHIAAAMGHVEVIQLLNQLKADFNVKNQRGDTPLHLAAKKGRLEVLRKLKECGCDLNILNSEGYAPVHLLAMRGNLKGLDLIKEMGEDLEQKASDGAQALYLSAEMGLDLVVEHLHQLGVSLESSGPNGQRAIHAASRCGHKEALCMLKKCGADVNARDDEGFNSRAYAFFNGQGECLQELEQDLYSREFIQSRILLRMIELEAEKGQTYPLFVQKQYETIRDFYLDYSSSCIHKEDQEKMMQVFEKAFLSKNVDDIFKSYQEHQAVLIPSGWRGGYVLLLFFDDLMVICNRGKRKDKVKTIEVWQVNPKLLTKHLIQQILDASSFLYERSYPFIYKELLKTLEAKEAEIPTVLEQKERLPEEIKEGNCAYANIQAIDFALTCLLHFKREYDLMGSYNYQVEEHKARKLLSSMEALRDYLSLHSKSMQNTLSLSLDDQIRLEEMIDIELLKQVWDKLVADFGVYRNGTQPLDEFVQGRFQEVEKVWVDFDKDKDGYRMGVFLSGLKSEDADLRIASARSLKSMVQQNFPWKSLNLFIEALDDEEEKVRSQCVLALSCVPVTKVSQIMPDLLHLLGDESACVVKAVFQAFKNIGSPAVNTLMELMEGEDSKLSTKAYEALKQMGIEDKAISEVLERMSRKKKKSSKKQSKTEEKKPKKTKGEKEEKSD